MRVISSLIAVAVSLATFTVVAEASASEVPAAPSNLRSQALLTIEWDDNSDNETGFRLQKMIFDEWLTAAEYPADATSAPFPSLGYDIGCLIPLRILAFNAAGESEPSATMPYPVPPPTPPPSGCPFADTLTFTNDTGHTANRLVLPQPYGYETMALTENAPGCPDPVVQLSHHPQPYFWEVLWPLPCVDPGESVVLLGTGTGPSTVLTGQWSLAEPTPTPTPATPAGSPTPTPAAAPTATVTPASLPVAGGAPGSPASLVWLLVAGAGLVAVATLALKRIR